MVSYMLKQGSAVLVLELQRLVARKMNVSVLNITIPLFAMDSWRWHGRRETLKVDGRQSKCLASKSSLAIGFTLGIISKCFADGLMDLALVTSGLSIRWEENGAKQT